MGLKCVWWKKFDGHYTMDCTNENGMRANGDFKTYPYDNSSISRWEFKYCPYCGGEIIIHKTEKP